MSDLDSLLASYIEAVEGELKRLLPPPEGVYRPFYGMLHYHLGWADETFRPTTAPRGKRVRAALCLLACEAVSGDFTTGLPAAAGVELLHEFSLIHDDIEDRDRERRHRPTLWVQWGDAQALNAGDGLFALAQLAFAELARHGLSAHMILDAQRLFNETALRLCQGQFLDMSFEQRRVVDPDEYLAMVAGKTAALLGFSVEVGAMIGRAPESDLHSFRTFGEAVGMAFQMQDDILGLWGDPRRTGKPAGNDLRRHKKSLPITIALADEGKTGDRIRELYNHPTPDQDLIDEMLVQIEALGVRAEVLKLAHQEHRRALEALDQVSLPAERLSRLASVASALLDRDH